MRSVLLVVLLVGLVHCQNEEIDAQWFSRLDKEGTPSVPISIDTTARQDDGVWSKLYENQASGMITPELGLFSVRRVRNSNRTDHRHRYFNLFWITCFFWGVLGGVFFFCFIAHVLYLKAKQAPVASDDEAPDVAVANVKFVLF